MSEKKGYLFMLLVVLIHSIPPIVIKFLYKSTNSFTTQMFWFMSASIWTLLLALILKKKNLIKEIKKHYKTLILFAITNTIGILGYFYGLTVLNPGVLSFLNRFGTIFTIMFGVLILKEKFLKKELVGVIISIIGLFILSYSKNPEQIFISLLFLASLIIYSYGFVIVKKNSKNIDPFAFMFVRAWFVFVVMTLITLSTNQFIMPDITTIPIFIIVPLFAAVIAQILQYTSFKYINISKAALIRNIQPFTVSLLSFFILKNSLSLRQIAGGIMVIIGLSIIVIFQKSKLKNIESIEDEI